jgi:hypothetical protein
LALATVVDIEVEVEVWQEDNCALALRGGPMKVDVIISEILYRYHWH